MRSEPARRRATQFCPRSGSFRTCTPTELVDPSIVVELGFGPDFRPGLLEAFGDGIKCQTRAGTGDERPR